MRRQSIDFDQVLNRLESTPPEPENLKKYEATYNKNYAEIIKEEKNIAEVFNILDKLLEKNLFPNILILNRIMSKLSKINKFELVKRIYDLESKLNIADIYSYSITIEAAGNRHLFEEAKKVFETAVNKGEVNSYVYGCMLIAARTCNQFDFAKEVYKQAVANNKADNMLHGAMITILILNNEIEAATQLHNQHPIDFQSEHINGILQVDLHKMTFGQAYLTLKKLLTENKEVQVVYGRGIHTVRHQHKDHPLKQAVLKIKQEMNLTLTEDPTNTGNVGHGLLSNPTFTPTPQANTSQQGVFASRLSAKAIPFVPASKPKPQ